MHQNVSLEFLVIFVEFTYLYRLDKNTSQNSIEDSLPNISIKNSINDVSPYLLNTNDALKTKAQISNKNLPSSLKANFYNKFSMNSNQMFNVGKSRNSKFL